MTEKELKKLNRAELLEMLVATMKETKRLEESVAALQQQLDDRMIAVDKSGSIAEAALQLNGVFRAAQAAADQYLENIRQKERINRKIEADAQAEAARVIAEAKVKAARIEAQAKENVNDYWADAMKMMKHFYNDHQDLKEMIGTDKQVRNNAETTHNRTIGSESDRE